MPLFSTPHGLPLIVTLEVGVPSYVDKRKREEIKMEVIEVESLKRGGSQGDSRLRCSFCKKWVAGADIKDFRKLLEVPCPHCGETGEELRENIKEVLQALRGDTGI